MKIVCSAVLVATLICSLARKMDNNDWRRDCINENAPPNVGVSAVHRFEGINYDTLRKSCKGASRHLTHTKVFASPVLTLWLKLSKLMFTVHGRA